MTNNNTNGTSESRESVLDLDVLAPERKYISISGEMYMMSHPDIDWGLKTRADFNRTWERIRELEAQTEFKETDETEYKNLSQKFMRIMLPECPPHILNKLGATQKNAIIATFFSVVGEDLAGPLNQVRNRLSSLQSWQDSNVSTEQQTPVSG